MAENNPKPTPFTADEMTELREMIEAKRARRWLVEISRITALWFIAIAGAWGLFSSAVIAYVRQHLGIGP